MLARIHNYRISTTVFEYFIAALPIIPFIPVVLSCDGALTGKLRSSWVLSARW